MLQYSIPVWCAILQYLVIVHVLQFFCHQNIPYLQGALAQVQT